MKIPNNKVKKKTSTTDFYLFYPYKITPVNGTVPKPYYPKSEYTNHKYTLGLPEWRNIIEIYLNNVKEYLIKGKEFQIPVKAGSLKLHKLKNKNPYKDYKLNSELTFSWCEYTPFLEWYKIKDWKSPEFLYSYVMKLTVPMTRQIHEHLKQDKDTIYTYSDYVSNTKSQ